GTGGVGVWGVRGGVLWLSRGCWGSGEGLARAAFPVGPEWTPSRKFTTSRALDRFPDTPPATRVRANPARSTEEKPGGVRRPKATITNTYLFANDSFAPRIARKWLDGCACFTRETAESAVRGLRAFPPCPLL